MFVFTHTNIVNVCMHWLSVSVYAVIVLFDRGSNYTNKHQEREHSSSSTTGPSSSSYNRASERTNQRERDRTTGGLWMEEAYINVDVEMKASTVHRGWYSRAKTC